jgi:hypothetical protein
MQRRTTRSAAIREIYRSGALATLARRAAGYRSDLDFAAFHKETIEEVFAGFDVDFLAVSAIKVDHRLQPLGGFDCVPLGLPESIVRSYQEVADADVVAPALYSNPGRIVSQATVLSEDAWLDHRFFRDHCRRYDIQRALMFGVLYPGHARKFITVEYLGSPNNGSFPGVDGGLLELATFPFTLAWLLRKGAMDDAMLERRFHALADLTGGELAALRKYVNSPYSDLAEQADAASPRRRLRLPSHAGGWDGAARDPLSRPPASRLFRDRPSLE